MGDNSQRPTWIFVISTLIPWLWGRATHRLAIPSSILEHHPWKGMEGKSVGSSSFVLQRQSGTGKEPWIENCES